MSKPPKKKLYQWNESGYFGVRHKFINDGYVSKLGASASLVYLVILSQTDHSTGKAEISLTTLSQLTGLHVRYLSDYLNTLKAHSLLEFTPRQGKMTRFWPLHHSEWKLCKVRTPTKRKRVKEIATKDVNTIKELLPTQCKPSLSEQERRNVLLQQGEQLKRDQLMT
jgi:hypothetical protein